MPEGEISMEDLIAIEQVARKLWEQTTKGTATEVDALSVLAKASIAQPRAYGSHHLAPSVGAP